MLNVIGDGNGIYVGFEHHDVSSCGVIDVGDVGSGYNGFNVKDSEDCQEENVKDQVHIK